MFYVNLTRYANETEIRSLSYAYMSIYQYFEHQLLSLLMEQIWNVLKLYNIRSKVHKAEFINLNHLHLQTLSR
jgi:hypothetical protein